MSNRTALRTSPPALELLEVLSAEHPPLHLLLDDSGCCGPGNVFVQTEPPRAPYLPIGRAGPVPVYVHPAFLRGTPPSSLFLDVRAAPLDDSGSLETAHARRFTVRFDAFPRGGAVPPADPSE
ncbi:MAG: hypothetical protein WBF81_02710 [Thermoplasmata archaeon]